MIYLFDYHSAKRLTEERLARSLAKYEQLHRHSPDVYLSPPEQSDAEVIELTFGAQCDSEPIGA